MKKANGSRAPNLSQIGPASKRVKRLPQKVAIIDAHISSLDKEIEFCISC